MAKENSIERAAKEQIQLPTERKQFKNLVLSNPNYFGTFPKLGGKVVKALNGNTTYEQLACLGLNQGSDLLEGVINIKQHSGYGTDGCGAGTTEYVRFFVQDGSGWHDLGVSSVQVYDLGGPLPLSYSISVNFSETMKFCSTENIVHVRAILSWEWEPTAGDPAFIPVWGNVVNAEVQVAPLLLYEVSIAELIAQKSISVDPDVLKDLDTGQSLPVSPPKPLSYGELKALYGNGEVPSHRFGFELAHGLDGFREHVPFVFVSPVLTPDGEWLTGNACRQQLDVFGDARKVEPLDFLLRYFPRRHVSNAATLILAQRCTRMLVSLHYCQVLESSARETESETACACE